jgi:hypothetical protein
MRLSAAAAGASGLPPRPNRDSNIVSLIGTMDPSRTPEVLGPVQAAFRAMGESILPPDAPLEDQDWIAIERIVEHALAGRPPGVRRQVRLFLRIANLLPLLSTGTKLNRLSPAKRAAFLDGLQRSRIALLRRGLWGIRTLLFMGYYTQDRVRDRIGYGASAAGWGASAQGRESKDQEQGP